MISTILVATNGEDGAIGALRLARALAERDGARVEVLAVYDPPIRFYGFEAAGMVAGVPSPFLPAAVEELHRQVQVQLAGVGGASGWPITVRVGGVAPTIARFAAECGAAIILLGLRPHGVVDRWLGRETLLRLTHLSHVPVLAVPEELHHLPRRVVAAVDLSDLSHHGARVALDVAAAGGELHLVHITWAPSPDAAWATTDWIKMYRAGVEEQIEQLASELRTSAPLDVRVHVRETQDPGGEILKVAEETGAELIVAGSHGHGYFGRIVLGSTSSRLLHAAHCAVLLAPPPAIPVELRQVEDGGTVEVQLGGEASLDSRAAVQRPDERRNGP
jgi:nucleotide-binding universal stress UspA family protein